MSINITDEPFPVQFSDDDYGKRCKSFKIFQNSTATQTVFILYEDVEGTTPYASAVVSMEDAKSLAGVILRMESMNQ